jgi:nickel/cobalt transporter (NicO) family protein
VRRLALLFAAAAALLTPASAIAHPLGNFTVNRFSGIELSGDRIYIKQVLDLAEVPTFQEGRRVRRPAFARELARDLHLEIDGRRASLELVDSAVRELPGAGGLKTLRFEAVYAADRRGRSLRFRDESFGSRIGWREIVVYAERGARVDSASAAGRSVSDELRSYPEDLLSEPLDVRAATATISLGSAPGEPPAVGGQAAERHSGGFEGLIARDDLGLGVILLSLAIAAFWGAAHALTPGHGKAIVAGYLVGSRGKPRHAVALGLIVTATHTAGVFALGLVTLLLSEFIVPEQLYPWLTLASGLLVVGVGSTVLWKRLRRRLAHAHHHDHHEHEHGFGRGGLLGVGIAAGLLPCPSALVVLLSAIALHRVGLGLALIVAFSLGLAATITTIGLIAVLARRAFGRLRLDGPLVRALPAASALVVLAVGVGITLNALPEVF